MSNQTEEPEPPPVEAEPEPEYDHRQLPSQQVRANGPPNEEKVMVIYEGNQSGSLLLSGNRAMLAGTPFEMSREELAMLRERLPWHRFHEVKD